MALPADAAWEDPTQGLPPVEIVSAKAMGTDAQKGQVLEDELGRIFIASRSLLVFDGQTWTSHPKPGEAAMTFLVKGRGGVLWAGMNENLGYFREVTFGDFEFHSLLPDLPAAARSVGTVWGCAPLGAVTYFICSDKILRWDGRAFQVTPFPTKLRLAPLRIGDEFWIQHLETGLYQLTDAGPELKFAARGLPAPLIIALFRDEAGVVTVSNDGLSRPGQEAFSPPALRDYLTQHKLSSFCRLPGGNLVFGTLSGGLVYTDPAGQILRIWSDASSGLPGRTIIGLTTDDSGEVLGTTPTDFFHFPTSGRNTVFNSLNGLRGETVNAFVLWQSKIHAATDDGAYRQVTSAGNPAYFESIPQLAARYNGILPQDDGFLLTRFGGVDWFDGEKLGSAVSLTANSAMEIVASRATPGLFYFTEYRGGISRLARKPDGTFDYERMLTLPAAPISLSEARNGLLWIGTDARGAFAYDPVGRKLEAIHDPVTQQPFAEPVRIAADRERLLFFLKGRLLEATADGKNLRPLAGVPPITSSTFYPLPSADGYLIVYERSARVGPLHAAGLLSFGANGAATWRELDLSHLDAIGSIRAATFTEERTRQKLWLGGMGGILRIDFDQIRILTPPTAPVVRILGNAPGQQLDAQPPEFPFSGHLVRFRVFTGDYVTGKNWLFQAKLGRGDGEWSPPTERRSFDYTNLSEGDYTFEVRALNPAGVAGPSAKFNFRVLPPWYRSSTAYLGYATALFFAVFGFIRVRERRIRARNDELEGLVNERTAELVKANAAKDEFLAGISHEIRNPMNGVIGIAENFRTDRLDLESRRKFGLLRQCANHLSSLLEDILDFSKVQAGAIELDPKPFDLPELVESVAGITRADSEKYGIPVEVAVSPAVPRKLLGDGRRIRQILINFVSNALKFSGRGQVSVTVWCKDAQPGHSEVIFAVSDEGPGISAEEQARLFTRFERGAAAQKGRVPGTGLGLALCKGLAEKMGGRIWLESELGHGSCFYFSAPFPIVETPTEPSPALAAAPVAARTALVVDDQEYNRVVLVDLLQSMGFNVQATQEGQAALDLAAREAFDVIFLDFNLPGLSGVDVARGIRNRPGPSTHALMLATTAFTTPEKRAQCLDAGMDAFLGKPVTRERLTKALSALPPGQVPAATAPVPNQAVPAAATTAPKKMEGPADPLGNLRLLARKKGVSVTQELTLYFAELDSEFAQLTAAIRAENSEDAGRFAHMLCGRCSFIYERELEQEQRKVEAAVADHHWAQARQSCEEFARQLASARVRLLSSGPTAPPA